MREFEDELPFTIRVFGPDGALRASGRLPSSSDAAQWLDQTPCCLADEALTVRIEDADGHGCWMLISEPNQTGAEATRSVTEALFNQHLRQRKKHTCRRRP